MGRFLTWLVVIVAVLSAAFLVGPRVRVDTTVTFDPQAIGADVEAYLGASEAKVPGIRDGLQKEIVWADEATKARTPLAIVYIHGFSASKGELRPLPDAVARELGANLFYARLTGHGQDSAAMAAASVNAWINDFAEAVAIGERLGDRVVVIATSTGGALATWAAVDERFHDRIAGLVLISPNYGVQAAGSWLLTLPWGKQIAELVIGDERSFETRSELHKTFWTSRYPTVALLPMAALTVLGNSTVVERAKTPVQFVFSLNDQVVRPDLTRTIAERWGGATEIVIVEKSGDPFNHVIAGDALSPGTTAQLARAITAWIGRTVPKS